ECGRPGQGRPGEDVGVVNVLVDGAGRGERPQGGVGDPGPQRRGEAVGAQDAERAVVEGACGGVDGVGETEPVVRPRRVLVGATEVMFAGAPVGGGEGGDQVRGELRRPGGTGEGAAEPFGVGRVAAVHEQVQAHEVADQACGDHGGAEVVADLAAAADEGLLLGQAPPLAGEDVQPQVAGVPAEPIPCGGEAVQAVMKDGARGGLGEELGGGGQPVRGGDVGRGVEAQ